MHVGKNVSGGSSAVGNKDQRQATVLIHVHVYHTDD